jgi:hypothetical protein
MGLSDSTTPTADALVSILVFCRMTDLWKTQL